MFGIEEHYEFLLGLLFIIIFYEIGRNLIKMIVRVIWLMPSKPPISNTLTWKDKLHYLSINIIAGILILALGWIHFLYQMILVDLRCIFTIDGSEILAWPWEWDWHITDDCDEGDL